MPTLRNFEQQPGFHWTTPVAEHAKFQSFVIDPPVHLNADDYLNGDFDPWADDDSTPKITLYGQAR